MKKPKQNCQPLEKHMKIFQDLMLVILQRRALLRAFESPLIRKDITENSFIHFYTFDYRRSQFADLRKFFDNNDRYPIYKFSFIIKHCSDKSALNSHKKLLKEWKDKFQDIANKYDFHLEQDFIASPVITKQLDDLIDAVNELVDKVIGILVKDGFDICSQANRRPDSDFLVDWQKEAFNDFKKVIC